MTCGRADVYVSHINPKPNPALYAEKYTAMDGHPAYVSSGVNDIGRPVYMTVIGTRLEGNHTCVYRMHVSVAEKRKFRDVARNFSPVDVLGSGEDFFFFDECV